MRMKETLTEIFQNKIVDILLVAVILWIGVFIINRLVQLFFKRTDFIEEKRKKRLKALSVLSPSIRRQLVLSFTLFLYLCMISARYWPGRA